MKHNAPHWWRPGDEKQYTFARSSGLPHGYFDRGIRIRTRWLTIAAAVIIVILL